MGQAPSNYFPTGMLDCKTAIVGAEGARYDYECTTKESVRYGLTLVHLLTLVIIFLLSMILYLIYWRICERRVYSQLRAVPKRLPVTRDLWSARMYRLLGDSVTRVSDDKYFLPPQGPHPPPPHAAGSPKDRAAFRTGVYAALHRLSSSLRESLAEELHLLSDGLRGARSVLVSRFRVPADALDTVLEATTLVGLDYRGQFEPPFEHTYGSTQLAGDGSSDNSSKSIASRLPLQQNSEGLAAVEQAVDLVITAIEIAVAEAAEAADAEYYRRSSAGRRGLRRGPRLARRDYGDEDGAQQSGDDEQNEYGNYELSASESRSATSEHDENGRNYTGYDHDDDDDENLVLLQEDEGVNHDDEGMLTDLDGGGSEVHVTGIYRDGDNSDVQASDADNDDARYDGSGSGGGSASASGSGTDAEDARSSVRKGALHLSRRYDSIGGVGGFAQTRVPGRTGALDSPGLRSVLGNRSAIGFVQQQQQQQQQRHRRVRTSLAADVDRRTFDRAAANSAPRHASADASGARSYASARRDQVAASMSSSLTARTGTGAMGSTARSGAGDTPLRPSSGL